MNNSIRTGTMIALASATLFAAACTKSKDNPPPADRMEAKEPAKPAAAAPASGDTAAPAAAPAQPV